MFYRLGMDDNIKTAYDLIDSPTPSLKRDSAELFVKENIPPVSLFLVRAYIYVSALYVVKSLNIFYFYIHPSL